MTKMNADILNNDPIINASRLWENANTLATMTLPDTPWTRRAFTPLFSEGRQWLQEKMEQAGLRLCPLILFHRFMVG